VYTVGELVLNCARPIGANMDVISYLVRVDAAIAFVMLKLPPYIVRAWLKGKSRFRYSARIHQNLDNVQRC
jgi:hypothetical protein